jgi:hypothetical protein
MGAGERRALSRGSSMAKPIPLSGGRKIMPSREDLERLPFSFFLASRARRKSSASYDISGLILDDEGDPLSGVTVTLSGDADSSVVTGADGAFLFEGLSKGDYTVTPTRASFVFTPASRSVTELAADTALDAFEGVGSIYLISGTITGDEAEGVTVTLSGDADDEVITGADGTYSFEGLADGSYTVTPSLDGYSFTPAATNVTINNADQTGQDFVSATSTYVVSGTVEQTTYDISGTITGDVVEGVTITLTGDASDSTLTDESGDYSFTGLDSGTYNVEPSLEGYEFDPTDIDVTIIGADDTGNDFVSYDVSLPWMYDFSDIEIADGVQIVGNVAEWVSGGGATYDEAASVLCETTVADSNGYTPPGVSKTAYCRVTSVDPSGSIRFTRPPQFSNVTVLRGAFLFRQNHETTDRGPYWTLILSNSDDTEYLFGRFNKYQDDTASNCRLVEGGVQVVNGVSGAGGTSPNTTRWHWFRFEIDFTNKTMASTIIRAEDSVAASIPTITSMSSLPASLSSSPDYDRIGVFPYYWQDDISVYFTKFWLGTGTDDWPT